MVVHYLHPVFHAAGGVSNPARGWLDHHHPDETLHPVSNPERRATSLPMTKPDEPRLILVLGDQLSPSLSSLAAGNPEADIVLMAEVQEEATYVRHHVKKIALVFSAMRHFAEELREAGWQVDYVRLDEAENSGTLRGEVERALGRHNADKVLLTEPGEWRLAHDIGSWPGVLDVPVEVMEDDRFLCSHDRFDDWASGRKSLRMEYFYREMRRETGYLMDGDDPACGSWNYDAENRKPPKDGLSPPSPPIFEPDEITSEVLELVEERFADHPGALRPFPFAVTRSDAKAALDHFVQNALPLFGDYQDAMLRDEPFLYHSLLSPYINIGLLDPREVCESAIKAWEAGDAPLNAVEGFVRQIIGWREYLRGIYWREMPGYLEQNRFGAERSLPGFYWTGKTDMACLAQAIGQTLEHAYAHHIQRLMITGNFAMLAGVDPMQVHEWYLAVYADAYEWVELPNTLGMSQFADGGLLASKPYAASANYISKMSDYCSDCQYRHTVKTGPDACPFNALYWDFLVRNRNHLKANARLGRVYDNWDRMEASKQREYRNSAAEFFATLD